VRLRYDFDVEKLIQAIAYMSSSGVEGLDKLKIVKLLFLADKKHLLEVGRPILGDWYSCMPYGPVPSQSFNIIRDVIDADPQMRPIAEARFDEYLSVDRNRAHPALVARRAPDLDVFSESEVSALDSTIRTYGNLTGPDLINLTHDDPIWTIPDARRKSGSSVEIPFELFFEVNGADDMLEFARAQQENRDFDSTISYEVTQMN
jgi:uncharacterized phage-associated protein